MFFFFFQAEDGIRDVAVTGVQTCALPICIVWLQPNSFPVYPDGLIVLPQIPVGEAQIIPSDCIVRIEPDGFEVGPNRLFVLTHIVCRIAKLKPLQRLESRAVSLGSLPR